MCRQVGGDLWFPREAYQEAIPAGLCRDWCPVAGECLADAFTAEKGLAAEYRYGVWGGLTPMERWVFDPSEPVEVRDRRVAEWLNARKDTGHWKADPEEVARLTRDGMAAPEIARRLGVSVRAVQRARSALVAS